MKITELIAGSKMSRFQITAVVVAIVLTVIDGYDNAMMVFAAPYVTKEFASSASFIGVVMSGALIGMVLGSILIAPIADKIGRRLIGIIGTVVVTIGMVIAPLSHSMDGLLVGRVVTGVGLGMLLSVVGVIAAEYSNRRVYPVVMSIYAAGINIGAVLGAVLVGPLLPVHGWRYGFWIGVAFSVIAIIIAIVAFPESITWLAARRKPGSLDRLNKTLDRMGHPPLPELPSEELRRTGRPSGALRAVFSKKLVAQTLLLVLGNIALLLSFYFANSWAPNTLADTAKNPAVAAPTTLALGLGGILGTLVFGFISTRVSPRVLTPIFLIVGAVGIAIFGSLEAQLSLALVEVFAASFFFSSGVAGFYQIAPKLYPTLARATGYGIVTGAGRIGGIAAPILAGAAFDAHMAVPVVFVIFALPLVVSALCLVALVAVEAVQRKRAGGASVVDSDGPLASLAN